MIPNLTTDEKSVYDCIVNSNGRVTQLQIAHLEPFLGSHPIHENYTPKASTLRRIRQIVRDLRMKHDLHILADTKGYFIMKNKEDGIKYVKDLEVTAKAQAKAWFDRYRKMSKLVGIKSDYFEQQGKLFEDE